MSSGSQTHSVFQASILNEQSSWVGAGFSTPRSLIIDFPGSKGKSKRLLPDTQELFLLKRKSTFHWPDCHSITSSNKKLGRNSLVQWLGIHLLVLGTQVQSPVREDFTVAEQLILHTTTTEPGHLDPVLHDKRGHGSEKPAHLHEG